jgi:hypothetical protein
VLIYIKIFNKLELMPVQAKTEIMFQYSASGNPIFPAPFLEESIFSPTFILGSFVKNQWLGEDSKMVARGRKQKACFLK